MSKIVVRPATREDIEAFSDIAAKVTIRAFVAVRDGEILGLGGIARHRGRWFGFVDLEPELRPHKMLIMRAAKRFLAAARRDGIQYIYAEVSPEEPRALAWLTSLGFEFDQRSMHYYRWSGN
jgi:hypothetical protein